MNKKDVNLLKRLVDIRIKMKELEEDIDEDIARYWELQSRKIETKTRCLSSGFDSTGFNSSYDYLLNERQRIREMKEKTLADMKKLYEEI